MKASPAENQVVTAAARSNTSNIGVVLQTAKTYAFGPDPNSEQLVRVLFDLCSQRTYISEELKQKLNLKSLKTETLNLNTFGTDKFRKQKCDLVEINLEGKDGSVIRLKPLVFPIICSPLSSSININEFPHLKGLEFADNFDGSQDCIDLLVGADQYFQIVSGDTIKGESENGPVAMSSKLGGLLVGPVSNSESDASDCISNLVIEGNSPYDARRNEDQELVQTLKRFWEIEQCGVEDNLDKRTNEFYDSLPGGKKQLQGNETNASFSGFSEFSLNERLDEGPNYIPSLFDVLVKFRVHPVALTADVEKAFLQIQIKPDDRDMLLFLWFDDVNSPDPCIVQFPFCRLPFGLRPSPSILGGTVRKHLENYRQSHPDIVEILKELYIDDLSSGADTTEKALEIYVVPRKS